MMKKIKSFIAVIAAMVLTANTVGAATIDKLSVVQNNEDGKATATVTVSGTSTDKYVSLAVIKPDMNEEEVDPTDSSSVADTYQILKNIEVVDGKYLYAYTVVDAEGEYTLKVNGAEPKTVKLMSYEDLNTFLATVNGCDDALGIVAEFENIAEELTLDLLAGYTLDKSKLGTAILAKQPFADVKVASEVYRDNAFALIIANPENAADAVGLVDMYAEDVGLNELSSYDVYQNMSTADKKKVIAHIAAAGVTDAETLFEAFGEQTILTAIAEAVSYGQVKELLDEHTDIIDIDWEEELKGVKATS